MHTDLRRSLATATLEAGRLTRDGSITTLRAMDRPSPFQILSLEEFDGLSFEEKLAYLDLQLTNLYGEAWREA